MMISKVEKNGIITEEKHFHIGGASATAVPGLTAIINKVS